MNIKNNGMIRKGLFGNLGAALLILIASTTFAQVQLRDVEEYRKAKVEGIQIFFDKSQPTQRRLEAIKHLGYPDDPTFAALLKVASDTNEDDKIRWEAARYHRYDPQYVETVLTILGNPENGGEYLNANLITDLNRRIVFAPKPEVREKMVSTLRNLLNDSRDGVRLNAYRTLVSSNDPVAVKALGESLKDPDRTPVPLAQAISFLNMAGTTDYYAHLRPLLKYKDSKVQAQVAKVLSVDSESQNQIVELVKNRDTSTEVRLAGIRALSREDKQFAKYAIPLIEDDQEKAVIKSAVTKAMVGRMNYQKVDQEDKIHFAEAVEQLSNTKKMRAGQEFSTNDKNLNNEDEVMHYLQENFPEIKKHYQK